MPVPATQAIQTNGVIVEEGVNDPRLMEEHTPSPVLPFQPESTAAPRPKRARQRAADTAGAVAMTADTLPEGGQLRRRFAFVQQLSSIRLAIGQYSLLFCCRALVGQELSSGEHVQGLLFVSRARQSLVWPAVSLSILFRSSVSCRLTGTLCRWWAASAPGRLQAQEHASWPPARTHAAPGNVN